MLIAPPFSRRVKAITANRFSNKRLGGGICPSRLRRTGCFSTITLDFQGPRPLLKWLTWFLQCQILS